MSIAVCCSGGKPPPPQHSMGCRIRRIEAATALCACQPSNWQCPHLQKLDTQGGGLRFSLLAGCTMEAHGPWANPPPWMMELLSTRLEMQDK